MKQAQLVVAAVLLAVMVFAVTFAMNYLGGGSAPKTVETDRPRLELVFAHKAFPNEPNPMATIEREEKTTGNQDFWFCNTNPKPVNVGLTGKNCKCTNVEVFVLPADASARIVSDVKVIDSPESLAKLVDPASGRSDLEKGATRVALDKEADHAEVPAGGLGWVRLNYKGEKPGRQVVSAKMWMDVVHQGPTVTLQLALTYHEALRVQQTLAFGTMRDEELIRGVTRYVTCFSSTRPSLKLQATAARSKGDPAGDPLEVGQPVPLDEQERENLKRTLEQPIPNSEMGESTGSKVTCAYKIPVTIRAVSADGKTPVDLGPFRRRLLVSSPEVEGEPKSVVLSGRVRGLIEVGSDEEGVDLNFNVFPRRAGRRQKIPLHSDTQGVKLEVDPSRMPGFLKASLTPVEGRSAWTLNVEVLPGMASGPFPRKDPLYEDSAVYLKATIPGKPPRSLRIGVSGTATEG
ncbi:MAG: hypothetical protein U0797_00160 [Gemmataceae bacterium]